jgi:hypothetical protein
MEWEFLRTEYVLGLVNVGHLSGSIVPPGLFVQPFCSRHCPALPWGANYGRRFAA